MEEQPQTENRDSQPPRGEEPAQKRIIGVKMEESPMIFRLMSKVPQIAVGDQLLLETSKGERIGLVAYISADRDPKTLHAGRISRIVRVLNEKDRANLAVREEKEREAFRFCQEQIREMKLPMSLSRVAFRLDGSKATFFFTAENRIDFRTLVRSLASRLHIRVEMRQVGVRDETRLLGGIGPCGQILCCAQHLTQFRPVSVKMAKNQDLSLNPDSISGICGRLLCCLAYENDVYVSIRKKLPKPGTCVCAKNGTNVTLKKFHYLKGTVTGRMDNGEMAEMSFEELGLDGSPTIVPPSAQGSQQGGRGGGREQQRADGKSKPRRGSQEGESRRKKGRKKPPPPPKEELKTDDASPAPEGGQAEGGEQPQQPAKKRRRRRRRRGRGKSPQQGAAAAGGQQNQNAQSSSQGGGSGQGDGQQKSGGGRRGRGGRSRRRGGGGGGSKPPQGGSGGGSSEGGGS